MKDDLSKMMNRLIELLKLINNRQTCFNPESDSEQDLEAFQDVAKALIYADKQGLIEKCTPHQENMTGNDFYDMVMISGGLTFKGKSQVSQNP